MAECWAHKTDCWHRTVAAVAGGSGCAERDGSCGGSDGVMNAWPHVLLIRGGHLFLPCNAP